MRFHATVLVDLGGIMAEGSVTDDEVAETLKRRQFLPYLTMMREENE